LTPSTSMTFPSFAETAICALADRLISAVINTATTVKVRSLNALSST